jgi:hypothetical protein
MTNPYRQAGRVAVGDHFIGRARLVRQVTETWQDAGRPSNLRVVGHHRVGKTSVVRRALDTSPPRADLVRVWLNVGNQDSDMDLFRSMVRHVLEETDGDGLAAVAGAIQTATVWYDLREGVRAFFMAVRARGLNVLVVLDEFDRAATAFTRLAPFQLLRDLASEADYSLGLITVSRQNIERIEVDAAGGSILGGVVSNARYVGMFTETEVDLMLSRAATLGVGLASVRDEIVSRTGPHPFLLELLCNRIVEIHDAMGKIDVAGAYLEETPIIEAHFARLLEAVNIDTGGRGAALLRGIAAGSAVDATTADMVRLRLMGVVSGGALFSAEFGRFVLLHAPS